MFRSLSAALIAVLASSCASCASGESDQVTSGQPFTRSGARADGTDQRELTSVRERINEETFDCNEFFSCDFSFGLTWSRQGTPGEFDRLITYNQSAGLIDAYFPIFRVSASNTVDGSTDESCPEMTGYVGTGNVNGARIVFVPEGRRVSDYSAQEYECHFSAADAHVVVRIERIDGDDDTLARAFPNETTFNMTAAWY